MRCSTTPCIRLKVESSLAPQPLGVQLRNQYPQNHLHPSTLISIHHIPIPIACYSLLLLLLLPLMLPLLVLFLLLRLPLQQTSLATEHRRHHSFSRWRRQRRGARGCRRARGRPSPGSPGRARKRSAPAWCRTPRPPPSAGGTGPRSRRPPRAVPCDCKQQRPFISFIHNFIISFIILLIERRGDVKYDGRRMDSIKVWENLDDLRG